MRKILNVMLVPVLASGLALAAPHDDKDKHDMDGKTKSMTGCVTEKDGNYWLVDKHHPIGYQLVSTEDMKAHVGHKVKVTGTMAPMEGDAVHTVAEKYPERKAATPDDPQRTTQKERREKHEIKEGLYSMNVTDVSMVSDTCKVK
jgi:hypothetical protein